MTKLKKWYLIFLFIPGVLFAENKTIGIIIVAVALFLIATLILLVIMKIKLMPFKKVIHTYFMEHKISENKSIVKIGFSKHPFTRINEIKNKIFLKTGEDIELKILLILPCNIEKSLHSIFKEDYKNQKGIIVNDWLGNHFKFGTEWFVYSKRIKKFINNKIN